MKMKLLFSIVLISVSLYSPVYSEMLLLEHGLRGAEPGKLAINLIDCFAGYDKWHYSGETAKYEYGRLIQNTGVTYTLSRSIEMALGMQYMYWVQRVAGAETAHLAGFGQLNADLKYCLGGFLTLGVKYFHNAIEPSRELGGGTDIKAYLVFDSESTYMNFGYVLTGDYNSTSSFSGTTVNYDPGDVMTGGIGIRLGKGNFKLLFELRANSYGLNLINGLSVPDTKGVTIDAFPGILLKLGGVTVKAGVGIGIGGTDLLGIDLLDFNTENYRGPGTNPVKYREISYDIAPVLRISYSF